jgi:hypothetical protein
MSKLSAKQVQDILDRYNQGIPVAILAREYFVTKMVIYYHIKTKGVYYVAKPKCYNDYLKNRIFRLQQQLLVEPHNRKNIESEISRTKHSMSIKRDRCSSDPFVLQ